MQATPFTEPCVEWEKSKNSQGYGFTYHEGKVRKAHRVAYAKHHGLSMNAIAGLVVRHRCDNPSCVNPNHLEIGTTADNNRDMVERGRFAIPRGEKNGRAILTETQVSEIKARHVPRSKRGPNSRKAIAKEFGVSISAISDIWSGKNWKGVK